MVARFPKVIHVYTFMTLWSHNRVQHLYIPPIHLLLLCIVYIPPIHPAPALCVWCIGSDGSGGSRCVGYIYRPFICCALCVWCIGSDGSGGSRCVGYIYRPFICCALCVWCIGSDGSGGGGCVGSSERLAVAGPCGTSRRSAVCMVSEW